MELLARSQECNSDTIYILSTILTVNELSAAECCELKIKLAHALSINGCANVTINMESLLITLGNPDRIYDIAIIANVDKATFDPVILTDLITTATGYPIYKDGLKYLYEEDYADGNIEARDAPGLN